MTNPLSEAGTSVEAAPFAIGELVETIKGAKFWGQVVSVYRLPSPMPGYEGPDEWRADVRAVAPDFLGTIHVYPITQLALSRRAAEQQEPVGFNMSKEQTDLPPGEWWMFYDHQIGKWCVYDDGPPRVVRTGAEVFHVREVRSPSPAGGVQGVTEEMVDLAAFGLWHLRAKGDRRVAWDRWLMLRDDAACDEVKRQARAALTAALSVQAQTTGGVE